MRITAILAVAIAVAVMPACKSHQQPESYQEMKKKVPDAKPTLHVAEDDPRYVASSGTATRQIHYYSATKDTTYVVDESTGKVVTTFKSKEMPGVVVVDKPAYQPPPLKTAEPEKAAEGCAPAKEEPAKEGCGSAPKKEGCSEGSESEEEEGCESEEGESEEGSGE